MRDESRIGGDVMRRLNELENATKTHADLGLIDSSIHRSDDNHAFQNWLDIST